MKIQKKRNLLTENIYNVLWRRPPHKRFRNAHGACRERNYEAITDDQENNLSVTRVISLSADNIGSDKLSIHVFEIKADCGWAVNGDTYDNILLIADYSSGKVYDEFTVDDDWQNKENSVEQQIGVLLHSILNSDDYDGGIILTDSETRTELSESEIAKINQALKQ